MRYTRTEDGFYLVKLEKGDKVISALTSLAAEQDIKSAVITGIGAVKDPHLGYFDINKKKYIEKDLAGNFELLNLHGNITLKEGKPFCHIHVVLGDGNFNAFGGHLMETEVTVTMEMMILPVRQGVERTLDKESSLYLWNL